MGGAVGGRAGASYWEPVGLAAAVLVLLVAAFAGTGEDDGPPVPVSTGPPMTTTTVMYGYAGVHLGDEFGAAVLTDRMTVGSCEVGSIEGGTVYAHDGVVTDIVVRAPGAVVAHVTVGQPLRGGDRWWTAAAGGVVVGVDDDGLVTSVRLTLDPAEVC